MYLLHNTSKLFGKEIEVQCRLSYAVKLLLRAIWKKVHVMAVMIYQFPAFVDGRGPTKSMPTYMYIC